MANSILPELDEDVVDLTSFAQQPNQLIPILQYCQGQNGYISRASVRQIAE